MTDGRSRLFRLGGVAVAAALLAFLIVAAKPAEVWDALGDVRGVEPWLVIALNPAVIAIWTLRSRLVLRHMGYSVPLQVLVPVTVLGNVAGSLTPGGSGEVLRAAALQRSAGLRLGESVTLVAYERVLSTYLLALSTLACIALVSLPAAPAGLVVAACAAGVPVPWACARVVLPRLPSASDVAPNSMVTKVLRYGLQLAAEIQALLFSLPLLLLWSTMTIATFAIVAWQFALVARSLGIDLTLLEGWVTFGGSGFAIIVSLLPLGIGIGDGSVAAIMSELAGVSFDRATAAAVLIRATVTLPLLLLALLSYLWLMRGAPVKPAPAEAER